MAVYWWSVVEMLILTVSVSTTDGSVLLVSGGDDNALTVHRLTLATHRASERSADAQPLYGGAMFDITAIITKPDAHAAQITGEGPRIAHW